MAPKKQTAEVTYNAEERRRYLFRTAVEMRVVLERVEAKQAERHGKQTGDNEEGDE